MAATISRRDLFRGRIAGPAPDGAAASAPANCGARGPVPRFRPPGALDEPQFLEACTSCDRCVEACPHDVLFRMPDDHRARGAAGTPIYDPSRRPCLACADRPCVTACGTGALRPEHGFRMGVARITEPDCLACQGTFCSACVERCPVPGALRFVGGRPVVDEATCTGCGVCHHVCPAPTNAVLLLPSFLRTAGSRR